MRMAYQCDSCWSESALWHLCHLHNSAEQIQHTWVGPTGLLDGTLSANLCTIGNWDWLFHYPHQDSHPDTGVVVPGNDISLCLVGLEGHLYIGGPPRRTCRPPGKSQIQIQAPSPLTKLIGKPNETSLQVPFSCNSRTSASCSPFGRMTGIKWKQAICHPLIHLRCNSNLHWYSQATVACTVSKTGWEAAGVNLGVRGFFPSFHI